MFNVLDDTIGAIKADSHFYSQFAATKSEPEIKYGMQRLREEFRRIYYQNLTAHSSIYGGLYQRADSLAALNKNELFIRSAVAKRQQEYRADADDGIFFARELEEIDPRRFEIKYKPLGRWREVLPLKATPPGLDRITYSIEDVTGSVEPVTVGRSTTVPYVGISAEEFSNKVVIKTLGYKYSVTELHRAAFAGVPLQDRYQKAVLRGYEKNLDKTMFTGDVSAGLEGLFNHTGVLENQASTAAGGTNTREWAGPDKTEDEILDDVRGMVTTVANQSQENYNSNNTRFILMLPRTPFDALKKPRATFSDVTLMNFILNNDYGISQIKILPELAGIGSGTTDLAVLMPVMDPEVAEAQVSDSILWSPVQFHDLDIRFPSVQYHGGVVVRYPIAMTQLTDV